MIISILGYNGFIGTHISKELENNHKIIKINSRKINYKLNENEIFEFLSKYIKDSDLIINSCANLKPKSKNDFFINENLSKIIQNYLIKNNLNTHLFHISTINVLIENRIDNYTKTKLLSEKNLKNNNVSIIRLPFITNLNENDDNKGNLKIFYNYLNKGFFPFYPMISPGNLYSPINIKSFCFFLKNIIENKNYKKVYNLMGKEKKTLWDLFLKVSKIKNKKAVKINTSLISNILPEFLKKIILKRSDFLSQIIGIDHTQIKENNITYL